MRFYVQNYFFIKVATGWLSMFHMLPLNVFIVIELLFITVKGRF